MCFMECPLVDVAAAVFCDGKTSSRPLATLRAKPCFSLADVRSLRLWQWDMECLISALCCAVTDSSCEW